MAVPVTTIQAYEPFKFKERHMPESKRNSTPLDSTFSACIGAKRERKAGAGADREQHRSEAGDVCETQRASDRRSRNNSLCR